ncbi:MAG: hypothetical protein LBR22_10655 [Desulfovibrio sp.]|jgi:hypothetical protein|nr:hypothetical protein [Desulfovibrio sp.]
MMCRTRKDARTARTVAQSLPTAPGAGRGKKDHDMGISARTASRPLWADSFSPQEAFVRTRIVEGEGSLFFVLNLDASPAAAVRSPEDDFHCICCGRPIGAVTPGRLCVFGVKERNGEGAVDGQAAEAPLRQAVGQDIVFMDGTCAQGVIDALHDASPGGGEIIVGQYPYCPITQYPIGGKHPTPGKGWPDVVLIRHRRMDIWDRIADGAHRTEGNAEALRACRLLLWADMLNARSAPEYMRVLRLLVYYVERPTSYFGKREANAQDEVSRAEVPGLLHGMAAGILERFNAERGADVRTIQEMLQRIAADRDVPVKNVELLSFLYLGRMFKALGLCNNFWVRQGKKEAVRKAEAVPAKAAREDGAVRGDFVDDGIPAMQAAMAISP